MSIPIGTSSGTLILSQELLDKILDFLHESVPSLSSCSLVSRNWLPTPRYHLFRTPVLYQLSLGRSPKDNTGAFLELLGSPLCTFRGTIRGCVLNIQHHAKLRRCINLLASDPAINIETLLVAHYSGVLSFVHYLQVPVSFPHLRQFVYSTVDNWLDDLPQLLTSLPDLESLSIYTRIHGEDKMPEFCDAPHSAPVLSKLKTLRLRMFNPSKFLQWMLELPGYTPQLETLDLVVYSCHSRGWGLVGSLESFLFANQKTLEVLTVGIQYQADLLADGYDVQGVDSLDIGCLTNLRSVFIRTHDVDALCDTIGPFLQSRQVSHIEALTLAILPILGPDGTTDHLEARLASTFPVSLSNKLGTLRIILSMPYTAYTDTDAANSERLETLSEGVLPNWRNSGILSVAVYQGNYWQVDSLEAINIKLWGMRTLPFGRMRERKGTL